MAMTCICAPLLRPTYYDMVGTVARLNVSQVSSIGKDKDDDHDQDYLKRTFWHIWSWSSENLFLERKRR